MMNSEAPWFERWFDSPYYHKLYKERDQDEARQFLDVLLNRIHLPASCKVLDLACGKGRHSLHLNQKGYDVTGVDLSAENINYCKQFENESLQFFQHDMRRVLRVNYFDAIFNLFTSFGYFDRDYENEKVVLAAASCLKKGGYFILDFMNLHFALRNLPSTESKLVEGLTFEIKKIKEANKLVKEIHIVEKGITFKEEICLLYPEDFCNYFAHAGLTLLETYGNYHLDAFHPETSQRLIFVTRKL